MEMEVPECPVCLQAYDGDSTTPRVLACGHSACESCLVHLPKKHPHTVRCPACTQLVKFPYPQGPSALPKNIDLLRFTLQNPNLNNNPQIPHEKPSTNLHQFLPRTWSDDFYLAWKDWILPHDALFVESTRDFIDGEEEEEENGGMCCLLHGSISSEGKKVSLFRVTSKCLLSVNNDDDGSVFDYSYTVRIMELLRGMRDDERDELGLILKACSRLNRVCKALGLWYSLSDKCVYLVCEEKYNCGSVLEKLGELGNGIVGGEEDGIQNLAIEDGFLLSGLAMVAMEICEVVIGLHSEGLVIGCLGLSCLSFDEFGHVYIDMNEILVSGRKVRGIVAKTFYGEKEIDDEKLRLINADILKTSAFVSPELCFVLLRNEGVECGSSLKYSVGYSSDVWSVACMLLRLLIGDQFTEKIFNHRRNLLPRNGEEHGLDYLGLCKGWTEKIGSLLEIKLGTRFVTFSKILCDCLFFDPGGRPFVSDIWKCIRELLVKPQFDVLLNLDRTVQTKKKGSCLAVGELCKLSMKISKGPEGQILDDGGQVIVDQIGEVGVHKDMVEGVSEGNVKFIPMQGHLDCVTGLAIGGGFLFSSSFDKMVNVWSLKDFTLVHSFRGHEHRVMAVVFVDEEQSLCISGDSGGGIFIWGISIPFEEEPLKKWYEEKDWRYSGIHALTVSGTEYLYTGSGDKLIKAWSLQEYTLSCTMSGHKSIVSALAVCDGVLYSGSWDGTIRLWSLNDHSPLTVLGEDTPGNVSSVLSLSVNQNMLVAAHENGYIKIWRDDVFRRSIQAHNGAVFALCMEGKWLFSGGWDKTLNVQELSGDELHLNARPIGSISCDTVIPALLYWQGKLIVGCADSYIKVYYYGR